MTNTDNNSVQLVGIIGKDVILTTFDNDKTKAIIILAVNEYQVNEAGENIKKTIWYRITAWGRMAKDVAAIAKKGNLLKVSGNMTHRTYTDASGKANTAKEIVMTNYFKINKKSKTETTAAPF